ncbi:MAG: glucosamine-6-phosphate deaminase [Verrucomicrobiales bacterium]|nr:glucosamine-6-phosphate deaminase [Verrucomicrobiales bacterium]
MHLRIHESPEAASQAAATQLTTWLTHPQTKQVMVAGGNTPLDLYARVAAAHLALRHLHIFMLDEYVGVPPEHPRNCANLLYHSVVEAWRIPSSHYHRIRPEPEAALPSALEHQRKIEAGGGLDVLILGLGQNGHLGFNEPGSRADSTARLVPLEHVSIEANRRWFEGQYAPDAGITVGLKTLLAARHILVLAFGPHKARAVAAMVEQAPSDACPASFLQRHPDAWIHLDGAAAEGLTRVSTK